MTDLTDLDVWASDSDHLGTHREIVVRSVVGSYLSGSGWEALGAEPNPAEVRAAAQYIRGLLARVACLAAERMQAERTVHGCHAPRTAVMRDGSGERPVREGREYVTDAEDLWSPGYPCSIDMDERDCCLVLMVPKARTKIWVDRIVGWLEQVQA